MGNTHKEPLEESWARSLLSGETSSPGAERSVYDRLRAAQLELRAARQEAQAALDANPLTAVTAEAAMAKANRRGFPAIEVAENGAVELTVYYKQPKLADSARRSWRSYYPSIGELRSKAEALGIDPTPYGRSKKKLEEAIRKAESATPMMKKTSEAVGPVTVVPAEEFPEKLASPSRKKMSDLAKEAEAVVLEELETPVEEPSESPTQDTDLDMDSLLS